MTLDKQMLLNEIKNKKGVVFTVILSLFLLVSLYVNFTHYNETDKLKKEQIIEKIDEGIAKNKEILKQIQLNIDSIHVEQKYTIEKIDGTQNSIKTIEKKRNEKVKYIYINNVDSTVSYLSDRYNKVRLP